jgi:hypothetical protein
MRQYLAFFVLFCLVIIVVARAINLVAGVTFNGFGMSKWYDLPLDFDDSKTLEFSIDGKSYFLKLLRVKGSQDLSKLWGGYPGDRNKYVAVSIETDDISFPLRGRMASFLDVNVVEVNNDILALRGGDGGGVWDATIRFDERNENIFFKYEYAKDDRCIVHFRM